MLLYRVAHQLADLVAVNIDSGALRVLAQPIPAHARDFSVDHDVALARVRQPRPRRAGMWIAFSSPAASAKQWPGPAGCG